MYNICLYIYILIYIDIYIDLSYQNVRMDSGLAF